MKGNSTLLKSLVVACLLLFVAGCSHVHREIESVQQHPSKDVMVLRTHDTITKFMFFVTEKDQFWYCEQSGSKVQCRKTCQDNPKCPLMGGANSYVSIRTNIAPKARIFKETASSSSESADKDKEGKSSDGKDSSDSN